MTTHPAVSSPTLSRNGVSGSGRAPTPPMNVQEAVSRLKASGGEERWPAVISLVAAMGREPSVEGALALARLGSAYRAEGAIPAADWLDSEADRILVEGQRAVVMEVAKLAGAQFTKLALEALEKEVGAGRWREIQAVIQAKANSRGAQK